MGDKTAIEWTDATWNPVTGCTKVSAGCKHCYAERVFPRAYRRYCLCNHPLAEHALPELQTDHSEPCMMPGCQCLGFRPRAFTDVRCHDNRLEQPLHWKKPRRIFVNSMSDLFHEDVPFEFIDKVFGAMLVCSQHTFQILTKRPERMRQYLTEIQDDDKDMHRWEDWGCSLADSTCIRADDWPPPNIWLGVSCEDQKTADERIPLLLQTPAAVRFVSYEPALGPIDIHVHLTKLFQGLDAAGIPGLLPRAPQFPPIDWVIAGSESGPKARDYETEWFANVARQCEEAGVPFFMKQLTVNGKKIPFEKWLGYLKVREFPI